MWEDEERMMSVYLVCITEWMMRAVPELEEHGRNRFGGDLRRWKESQEKRAETTLKRVIFESW